MSNSTVCHHSFPIIQGLQLILLPISLHQNSKYAWLVVHRKVALLKECPYNIVLEK